MNEPPKPKAPPTPEQKRKMGLAILALKLRVAKGAEEQAKQTRIAIEEAIVERIPSVTDTGQVTETLDDGTKIIVKRGLSYKADLPKIGTICNETKMAAPISSKTAYELDVKGYEWYRTNNPAFFTQLTQHVTVTPRKVAVTLKEAK